MKNLRTALTVIGVTVLFAGNSFAAGIGAAYGQYTKTGNVISLNTSLTSMTKVANSVVGQDNFAQYKVNIGGKDYWYTIMDKPGATAAEGDVRQETFVRAHSVGALAGDPGAAFQQELKADAATTSGCTYGTTLTSDCLKISMDYKGLGTDKSFTLDMDLVDGGTSTGASYQQQFHYDEKAAASTSAISTGCASFVNIGGTAGTACNQNYTTGTGNITVTNGTSISTANTTVGERLVHVWFEDSVKITNSSADNFGFAFESADKIQANDTTGPQNPQYKYTKF